MRKIPVPKPFVHEIAYGGETLGIIARWYTGDPLNWELIANRNPELNVNNLQIGDKVLIPREILFKELPLPEAEIGEQGEFSGEGEILYTEGEPFTPGLPSLLGIPLASRGEESKADSPPQEAYDKASPLEVREAITPERGARSKEEYLRELLGD